MSEHGLHAVRSLGVLAEARLALDGHAGVLGDLAQLVGEGPEQTLRYTTESPTASFQSEPFSLFRLENVFATLALRGEAGDGPHLDFYAGVELLAPHVPHAVTGRGHCAVLK